MTELKLLPSQLRLRVDPARLGFADTAGLCGQPLPWIGQLRAEQAARFGLRMREPDYHLLVLGEPGSGRSTLLARLMHELAAQEPPSTDLCFVHNAEAPAQPLALRLPAGDGRRLRDGLQQLVDAWKAGVPRKLAEASFVDAFARLETVHCADEDALNDALVDLRRRSVKPLLDDLLQRLRHTLAHHMQDAPRLSALLRRVHDELLDQVGLFQPQEAGSPEEALRLGAQADLLRRLQVNLVVDRHGDTCAPVVVDDDPAFRTLFGSIEYEPEGEVMSTDFRHIRAGSLLRAHGGYLLLHLRDLLADDLVWEKFRRFLRSARLQIEEPGTLHAPVAAVSLMPEPVAVQVKLVLVAALDEYYAIHEADPELARRFRCKVDFADSFIADASTWHDTAVWVARLCAERGLPHFSAHAVAELIEETHRMAQDQSRQSAAFGRTEALVLESAALARDRDAQPHAQTQTPPLTQRADVQAAREAQRYRHNQTEQRLLQTIAEGERVLDVSGSRVARVNGLTVIELGDHRFGFPARVTACTHAGEEGLLNIEREVELSGPIHDKGVLILHAYLASLFGHLAPLTLNAAIGFDQEYAGVEGDSASCAELCALLSALSGVPLRQSLAVTGAINQHGEMLPVGGINEKIEGFFKACELLGLNGQQGVVMPRRNARHLMLDERVVDAVRQGCFHVHAVDSAGEAMQLLGGVAFGAEAGAVPGLDVPATGYAANTVLGCAQRTLERYRVACESFAAQAHLNVQDALAAGAQRGQGDQGAQPGQHAAKLRSSSRRATAAR